MPLLRLAPWLGALALAACASPTLPPDPRLALAAADRGPAVSWSGPLAVAPDRHAGAAGSLPSPDAPAAPQDAVAGEPRTAPVGIGFTGGPSSVLFGGAVGFAIEDDLTLGPAVQLGVDDDTFLLASFARLELALPVAAEDGRLSRWQPFLQAGAGFVYLDEDRRGDDFGFLLNGGAGIRYATDGGPRIGSSLLLNVVPAEVNDERFYVSWEVIQVVFDF